MEGCLGMQSLQAMASLKRLFKESDNAVSGRYLRAVSLVWELRLSVVRCGCSKCRRLWCVSIQATFPAWVQGLAQWLVAVAAHLVVDLYCLHWLCRCQRRWQKARPRGYVLFYNSYWSVFLRASFSHIAVCQKPRFTNSRF